MFIISEIKGGIYHLDLLIFFKEINYFMNQRCIFKLLQNFK